MHATPILKERPVGLRLHQRADGCSVTVRNAFPWFAALSGPLAAAAAVVLAWRHTAAIAHGFFASDGGTIAGVLFVLVGFPLISAWNTARSICGEVLVCSERKLIYRSRTLASRRWSRKTTWRHRVQSLQFGVLSRGRSGSVDGLLIRTDISVWKLLPGLYRADAAAILTAFGALGYPVDVESPQPLGRRTRRTFSPRGPGADA